jgi:predicted metalloprotease
MGWDKPQRAHSIALAICRYIDLSFIRELQRLGASGEFAFTYVVARKVSHHVQNIVVTADQVRTVQSRASETDSNQLLVRMELQADCYAGVGRTISKGVLICLKPEILMTV